MPFPFNQITIADTYGQATEVVFPRQTTNMAVHVLNNGVFYTLLLVAKGALQVGAYQQDTVEHALVPSLSNFDESDLPAGQAFAGIKFRNSFAGRAAVVTVI